MIEDNIALAKRFEGLSLVPYVCPAGYWTIGYGHLIGHLGSVVKPNPITLKQANDYLLQDVSMAEALVIKLIPVLARPNFDQKLVAIIDFEFNLGAGRLQSSTLRRRCIEQDWLSARREILKWCHGGGKLLPGLVARRHYESLLL